MKSANPFSEKSSIVLFSPFVPCPSHRDVVAASEQEEDTELNPSYTIASESISKLVVATTDGSTVQRFDLQ